MCQQTEAEKEHSNSTKQAPPDVQPTGSQRHNTAQDEREKFVESLGVTTLSPTVRIGLPYVEPSEKGPHSGRTPSVSTLQGPKTCINRGSCSIKSVEDEVDEDPSSKCPAMSPPGAGALARDQKIHHTSGHLHSRAAYTASGGGGTGPPPTPGINNRAE